MIRPDFEHYSDEELDYTQVREEVQTGVDPCHGAGNNVRTLDNTGNQTTTHPPDQIPAHQAASTGTQGAREFAKNAPGNQWNVYRWPDDSAVFKFAEAFAADLRRQLADERSIKEAEKKILIQEIERNKMLSEQVAALTKALEAIASLPMRTSMLTVAAIVKDALSRTPAPQEQTAEEGK